MMSSRLRLILGMAIILTAFPRISFSETPGTLRGRVTDTVTGRPLPGVNVAIKELEIGALTAEDGIYLIARVPPGTYTILVRMLGYTPITKTALRIEAGLPTILEVNMTETVVSQEKETNVIAERPLVEVKVPSTVRSVTGRDIQQMSVQSVVDLIGRQPGVSKVDEEIHIRGGRVDEVAYYLEGVRVRDLIGGTSGAENVGSRSVAEMNVITGGFNAEYGEALSGIVEVKTKEGGKDYHGLVLYTTDHPGLFDYFNSDQINVQIGGPEPILKRVISPFGLEVPGQLTFFLDASTSLSDTYLPGIRSLPGNKKLRPNYVDETPWGDLRYGSFLTPRQDNKWMGSGKLVWKPSVNKKFELFYSKMIGIDQGFSEFDIGDITRTTTGYAWEWSRRMDHYQTVTQDRNITTLTFTQGLGRTAYHVLRLSRVFSSNHRDVAGKLWWEYEKPHDEDLPDSLNSPYFYDTGDAPDWRDRYGETYTGSWTLAKRFPPNHNLKTGIESSFENVQYISIRYPWAGSSPLGEQFDLFHVYPATGALYVQDQFEFEGLVGNVGVRYDYWFPGKQLERAVANLESQTITPFIREGFYRDTKKVFGERMKTRTSPRLAISFPITESDNLFFNYGRFSQRPTYYYVYSKMSAASTEKYPRIGNPNLNPEVSVQYELGARRLFGQSIGVNVVLFNKDIYDYPTAATVKEGYFIYRNVDYARSRGIEIELKKRRIDRISGSIDYTYSLATGKSSDPSAAALVRELGGNPQESELGEVFMWWNRPHKLSLGFDYRVSSKEKEVKVLGLPFFSGWGFNLYGLIWSGRAYTPVNLKYEELAEKYSKNGRFEVTWDLRFEKELPKNFRLTFQGWNIFNERTAVRLDPVTGKPYKLGEGSLVTYTRYQEAQYSDPSLSGRPRNFKLGIEWDW
ncbi:MAG: TonB-dependent receptor [Candidatus Eisenbacteria bacterium]|nr:TonB-dependent receptor [Candidatus Eisenbacteria bacterium]